MVSGLVIRSFLLSWGETSGSGHQGMAAQSGLLPPKISSQEEGLGVWVEQFPCKLKTCGRKELALGNGP